MNFRYSLLVGTSIIAIALIVPSFAQAPEKVSYKNQIAPLLKKNCYSCHNANGKSGELDLTSEAAIRKGGEHGKIVVPKKSGESRLMGYLKHSRGYKQMPPGEKLKDAEIKLIAKWIDEGLNFKN